MFWALKSSDLTSKIVENVQSFSQDYLSSRPIFGGYSYDSVGRILKETAWEVTSHLAKDDTEWAADELINRTKDRMRWSPESSKHEWAFYRNDLDTLKPEEATEALAEGLITSSKAGNSFAASDNDSKNFKKLRDKAGLSEWNSIIDLVWNQKFREQMSKWTNWNKFLNNTLSSEEWMKNLVWWSDSELKKLKAVYNTQAEKFRNWYDVIGTKITAWDPTKDESITTAYIRNDGVYSYTTSLKDKNTTISKVEYGAKWSKEAGDILNGFKDNRQWYASSIWAKLFNPNGILNQPTWLVYNTVTNQYQVRTDDDEKNRQKSQPDPKTTPSSQEKTKTDPNIASTTPPTTKSWW